MRAAAKLIPVACLCLLGLQLSGLHMHVDMQGVGGHAHGAHVHPQSEGGDDHGGEKDLTSVTLGAPGGKLLLFLVAFAVPALALVWAPQRAALPPVLSVPRRRRRPRWRPPLRAPPRFA